MNAELSETRACCFSSFVHQPKQEQRNPWALQWNKGWCVTQPSRLCIVRKTQKHLCSEEKPSSGAQHHPPSPYTHRTALGWGSPVSDLSVLFYHLYGFRFGLGQFSLANVPDSTLRTPNKSFFKGSFHPPQKILKGTIIHIDHFWTILVTRFSLSPSPFLFFFLV